MRKISKRKKKIFGKVREREREERSVVAWGGEVRVNSSEAFRGISRRPFERTAGTWNRVHESSIQKNEIFPVIPKRATAATFSRTRNYVKQYERRGKR